MLLVFCQQKTKLNDTCYFLATIKTGFDLDSRVLLYVQCLISARVLLLPFESCETAMLNRYVNTVVSESWHEVGFQVVYVACDS